MNTRKIFFIILACALASCANKGAGEAGTTSAVTAAALPPAPDFSADSAYLYVKNQVDFGPRVPNSQAHKKCGDYLIAELERFGAQLYVQDMMLTAYNGDRLESRNIIGSYNPDNPKRILLFAHWDSRPYADNEPDAARQHHPIDGADDGASGVGVLLEIARQIGIQAPTAGIDIIFFDVEDYGAPEFAKEYGKQHTYCLGTQFWAKNPHTPNYRADYGILLDMTGAKNATFYKELTSLQKAASIVEKVWSTARNLGYGKFFINARGGNITDDHQYVIFGRGIPCIDIINYNLNNARGFADHWHTLDDTMDNINRETLKAVGQTVVEVIYKHQ